MTSSPRMTVVAADGSDPAVIAAAAAGPLAAIGVPVVRVEGEPVLADGIPGTVALAGGVDLVLVLDPELAGRRGFTGKESESLVVLPTAGDAPAVVFLGCGDRGSLGADPLRNAAAELVRAAGRSGAAVLLLPRSLVTAVGGDLDASSASRRCGQVATEGAVLAGYRYTAHKSADEGGRVGRVVVAGIDLDAEALGDGVRRGTLVSDAVCLARDLVNEPPSTMTPGILARLAGEEVANRRGVTLEIWDEGRIEAERLGGLLGVARGSAEPPRVVVARYEPPDAVDGDPAVAHVVLVGKGITFDSGGLSLKTADGMMTMKTDMGGAAAVLAAVSACGDLGVRARVTAITPITENMPGGRATKPGDVLTIRNGKTIEVLNTDAEGRLVLADGLTLAAEMRPDAIVDVATLTGACVVALGDSIAGLLGNDDALVARLRAAADRAGEPLWPLPLTHRYSKHIDSEIADMKNTGKAGQAGTISAALLLERFVDGVPWAHLDIAGPARSGEDAGVLTKGGTGFGVRTLLELVEGYGDGDGAEADSGAGA